jgi:hypothetical protein
MLWESLPLFRLLAISPTASFAVFAAFFSGLSNFS